jgi:hypothetical protein
MVSMTIHSMAYGWNSNLIRVTRILIINVAIVPMRDGVLVGYVNHLYQTNVGHEKITA